MRLLSFGLVFSMVVAEAQHGPDLDRLLNQWAAAGAPSEEMVAGVMSQIDLRNADLEKDLVERIQQAGKARGASAGAAFENEVKLALDQYRFAQVQKVLDSVYAKYGGGLEAAVRTGSSGVRHMNMGAQTAPAPYRFLFSDDDISFVGRRGVEAAEAFNAGIRNAGLGKVKVSGFDLITLKNVRSLDLTALDLLEPEKFLGASGLGGIKKEMLKNGAVIAKNAGSGMAATAEPLAAFVEAKESAMLAELLDEKAIVGVVEKYGSMTMVASCERQIVEAHGGWDKLTPPERAKYVLRQRLALRQSGALRDIASLGGPAIEAEIAWLQKLKAAGTLTPQENAYLLSMRGENVRLAFAEIPTKLNPILAAAEADGRSLAANPQVRKAIEELATGLRFAGQDRDGAAGSTDPGGTTPHCGRQPGDVQHSVHGVPAGQGSDVDGGVLAEHRWYAGGVCGNAGEDRRPGGEVGDGAGAEGGQGGQGGGEVPHGPRGDAGHGGGGKSVSQDGAEPVGEEVPDRDAGDGGRRGDPERGL